MRKYISDFFSHGGCSCNIKIAMNDLDLNTIIKQEVLSINYFVLNLHISLILMLYVIDMHTNTFDCQCTLLPK